MQPGLNDDSPMKLGTFLEIDESGSADEDIKLEQKQIEEPAPRILTPRDPQTFQD